MAWLIATLINTLIVAWLARRTLGVDVGWPRTLVLSAVTIIVASPLLTGTLGWFGLGVDTFDGSASRAELTAGVVVVIIVLAWAMAAELALLTLLEALLPTGTAPSPLALLRSMPARRRRAARYASIVGIASRHGLGAWVRPARGRAQVLQGSGQRADVARHLREALTEGGVTFVKLGQMLGTRGDLLPPEFIEELGRLHSDVPPVTWEQVRAIVESELGAPLDTAFASVDPQPLAAASLAQVHTATLHSGEQVVLKVQRPDADTQVAADLDVIERFAGWLQDNTEWGRSLRTADLAAGLAQALREELDYRVELGNMETIGANTSGSVAVPRTWPQWCTSRLLVMERVEGSPLSRSHAEVAALPDETRDRLADDLFATVLRQILVSGVFHADLHAGNVIWSGDRLVLLDFGSVGRLDRATRDALAALLLAFDRQDALVAADSLVELLGRPDRLDERRLERDLGDLLMRGGDSASMFGELIRLVTVNGFSVPPMIAAAFRAFGAVEGTLVRVSPKFDAVRAARARAGDMLAEQLTREQLRSRAESQLATVVPMLQRLPRRIDKITESLEQGRLSANVRLLADPDDRAFLTGLVNQAITAMLAATCLMGGVLLTTFGEGPEIVGGVGLLPTLGAALGFVGFALSMRLLAWTFIHNSAKRRP